MAASDYRFVTRWCFAATVEEVAAVLEDIESLPNWWSDVYLSVTTIKPGDATGVGRKVDLLTKGKLPYKLRWQFTVTESRSPEGFTIDAEGDFVGRGVWTLKQVGDMAHVEFDWEIRAEKPLLKSMSWALKPIFSWNHRWAMEQGERSLCAELKRRRRGGDAS